MQKTEYGYGKVVRIGILCLIFAICMEKHTYGSIVVDEVLIGGQEEQAPVDAAPAAQASAEPNAAKSTSEQQAEPDASKTQADPDTSQPASETQTKRGSQSTSTSQEKPSTYLQNEKKVQKPSIKQADTASTAQTDPGQLQDPAESTSSVSANDKQQFHIPQQETQKKGDKTAKSENSSGKNTSGETAKREMKAQEQPSIWQDTAETADKEKMENKAESEDKTGSLLLPGFMILCILLLLAGSICLIRDNNIDLKK